MECELVEAEASVGGGGDVAIELRGVGGGIRGWLRRGSCVIRGLRGAYFRSGFGVFHIVFHRINRGGVGGFGAEVDNTERKLMDDFGRARDKSVRSGAHSGEDSLCSERDKEGDNGDKNETWPFLATDNGKDKENEEGDRISIDGATRKREKKGRGKEHGT